MRDKKPKPGGTTDPVETTASSPKKKYQAPRLVEYGDLRRIVMAKGGTTNDGAKVPATKR